MDTLYDKDNELIQLPTKYEVNHKSDNFTAEDIKPHQPQKTISDDRLKSWRPTINIITLSLLIGGWESAVLNRYFYLHHINIIAVLFGGETFPILHFVTNDVIVGPMVEVITWAGTAVVIRHIIKLARKAGENKLEVRKGFMDFIADYAESVFLSSLLMALLRLPKITIGTGINVSLDNASIDVIISYACVLGWSIRETRILFSRILQMLVGNNGSV